MQPKWGRPVALSRIGSLGSILRNRKIESSTKVALMEVMCGTSPTPAWLRAHGWAVPGGCPCGMSCDVGHLLAGCSVNEHMVCISMSRLADAVYGTEFSDSTRELINHDFAPGRRYAFIDGKAVDANSFWFRKGYRVYTDGAAVHVGHIDLAIASSAAIQIVDGMV